MGADVYRTTHPRETVRVDAAHFLEMQKVVALARVSLHEWERHLKNQGRYLTDALTRNLRLALVNLDAAENGPQEKP